jgi:hypothetical protein
MGSARSLVSVNEADWVHYLITLGVAIFLWFGWRWAFRVLRRR